MQHKIQNKLYKTTKYISSKKICSHQIKLFLIYNKFSIEQKLQKNCSTIFFRFISCKDLVSLLFFLILTKTFAFI